MTSWGPRSPTPRRVFLSSLFLGSPLILLAPGLLVPFSDGKPLDPLRRMDQKEGWDGCTPIVPRNVQSCRHNVLTGTLHTRGSESNVHTLYGLRFVDVPAYAESPI